MSFPRYPKYKDSGVEWLGHVPEHWELKRLGYFFAERREKVSDVDFPALSVTKNGIVPQLETAAKSDDGDNRKKVCREDFVINSRSDRKGSSGVSSIDGSVSLICTVLRPQEAVHTPFVHHLLRSLPFQEEFYRFGKGIVADLWSTNFSEMRNILLAMPGMSEQIAIAAFLDRETAKIDALVAEQQRLMELLKEKRQAVISHAVTRGLNPAAPLKDSGIEWPVEIPDDWDVKPIKYLVEASDGIQMGPFGRMLLDLDSDDTGFKVYGQENTISGDFSVGLRWISEKRFNALSNYHVAVGDLLLTRKGSLGNARLVKCLPQPGIADSDTIRVRVNSLCILPVFLALLLHQARYIEEQINLTKRGAILAGLNSRTIANISIILPPLAQQEQIMVFLNKELTRFDNLTNEVKRTIDLLQERRTALISAAVTGQIDVRESAASSLTLVKPYSSGFARQLLAAEILDHCHQHPTMGRVKLQKLIHLCEHIAEVEEVGAHYARKAAGPFDNKMMFGIASGLSKQKWFAEVKDGLRTLYQPLEHAGEHRKYLARWEDKMPQINKVLHLLGKADTQQCEIVSTLYAAWNDLLIEGQSPTDEVIIHEASSPDRWHENKAKIPPEKWPKALAWMREKGLVPKGFGNHTSRPN